ncbi:Predicted PurR-regulated permease PerM [Paenibacillus tianmuensis]|uniref:Predicted PurR-regulated permease PerM n=1 Tax=Paenibacillus tianmuensis TaxID=624147 RepID=A0A1G4TTJ5_9BACL|nr:AI-2E family transporter [Paenibacillus tianmuensis]SCW84597.1 Predicted PurR-regulated permease PerM [Paenibacillus tianmuensis]
MEWLKMMFSNLTVRRFAILFIVCFLMFQIRDMLNLVLLTFLLTYIMYRLQGYITAQLNRVVRVSSKLVVILLYLLICGLLGWAIYYNLPKIIFQVKQLYDVVITLMNSSHQDDELSKWITGILKELNLQSYVKQGFEYVLKISNWGTTFVFALILSFFFILEKNRIVRFTSQFRTSKIAWLYNELEYFGRKFVLSFGKVIEAQLLIAVCNTVFTMIGLWLLGFPYLFALSIMVFLLSLIPVAGFIISLIPLSIIGFALGGWLMIVYVVVMIMILHFLEGYFLNPKLMSSKTNLPMFYTFIILLFSQHYFGGWGLIIGIPVFVFLLDILDVNVDERSGKG